MIHGIGCDLLEIARVEALYRRYGDRLMQRILTPLEREQANRQASPAPRLAKYIAAKEAAFKALGVARDNNISWQHFEVRYAPSGQPLLTLHRSAKDAAPDSMRVHLSLSDTHTHALAYVIIEGG